MIRPLCAICADRIATTITDWECASGAVRPVVACRACLEPVPDPPEEFEPVDPIEPCRVEARQFVSTDHTTREALIATIAAHGPLTFGDLLAVLGCATDTVRATLRKGVTRLEQRGIVTGDLIDPRIPQRGKFYRIATEARRAA